MRGESAEKSGDRVERTSRSVQGGSVGLKLPSEIEPLHSKQQQMKQMQQRQPAGTAAETRAVKVEQRRAG